MKSKNVIFTICAKNYLAHAKTLGHSIRKFHPECDFIILLSDEIGSTDIKCHDFNVIESKDLQIEGFQDMAFKYNVIEFSTSIKPFFIDMLINDYGYEKILYLDPDMVVYSSMDFLFDELTEFDAILTPHIIKPYVNYTGATSEEELLFVGIYNLGFFAINNSLVAKQMIAWWKEKLSNQCFAEKEEALHVDQKWMDFLPALYGDRVLISRHPGLNLAFWNFHERTLINVNGQYTVDEFPLVIMHFSGLVVEDFENVCRKQSKYTLSKIPEYRELFMNYVNSLKRNDFDLLSMHRYEYNFFDNGTPVLDFYRRLYRQLVIDGKKIMTPFSTSGESFYELLKSNKLLLKGDIKMYSSLKKTFGENPPIIGRVFGALKLFKKVVGINKYYLMLRFFRINNRFEKQTYLLKK